MWTSPDGLLQQWASYSPTRVRFGARVLDSLGEITRDLGKSALVITGQSALRTGLFQRCRKKLLACGIQVHAYHDIHRDPTIHQVDEIAHRAREQNVDVLVAVGGGSTVDATKAAAAIATGGGHASEYLLGERTLPPEARPVVAVPTTAGTGAELSRGAILSWPERALKRGLRGDVLYPHTAVVDPELTVTLSPEETKITGFDCFSHAVETFLSQRCTPMTAAFSRQAVISVCKYLPLALRDPADMQARTGLSFHSMMMGYNLANSTTCLPHRLQYAVATVVQAPHGAGLAALYPTWVETTCSASPERFRAVASWMAEGLDEDPSASTSTLLECFQDRIGLHPSLRDLGMTASQCAELAGKVEGDLTPDPWWQEGRDLQGLLQGALGTEPDKGD